MLLRPAPACCNNVNRSRRALPLHGVQNLLRLGQRLIELHRRSPEIDRHLLPLDIVQDDEAVLLALAHPEVVVGYVEQGDARLGAELGTLRRFRGYRVELLAANSPYANPARWLDLQARMVLKPRGHVIWSRV